MHMPSGMRYTRSVLGTAPMFSISVLMIMLMGMSLSGVIHPKIAPPDLIAAYHGIPDASPGMCLAPPIRRLDSGARDWRIHMPDHGPRRGCGSPKAPYLSTPRMLEWTIFAIRYDRAR